MPRQVKSSEDELFALCDEIQAIDGKVTAARLREAAGGGGHIRLKAVVEAWQERRNEAAKPAEAALRKKPGGAKGRPVSLRAGAMIRTRMSRRRQRAVRHGAGIRMRLRASRLRMPSRPRLRWRREGSKPRCPVGRPRRPRHRTSRMFRHRSSRPRRRSPKLWTQLPGRKLRMGLHLKLKRSASRKPTPSRQKEQRTLQYRQHRPHQGQCHQPQVLMPRSPASRPMSRISGARTACCGTRSGMSVRPGSGKSNSSTA